VVYTEEQLLGNRWPSLEQLQLTLPQVRQVCGMARTGARLEFSQWAEGTRPPPQLTPRGDMQVEVPEVRETIAHSGLFTRLCLRAFKECDVDKSGTVDRKELHVMLLLLYDKLNRKLPCHVNPPKRSDVERLLAIHDVDGSGGLDPSEFLALSRSLILSKAHWKESLFVKLSLGVAFHMALLPVIAFGFKSILMVAGVASAARLPTAVLAGGIGTVGTLAWNYFKEEGRTREGEVDVEE